MVYPPMCKLYNREGGLVKQLVKKLSKPSKYEKILNEVVDSSLYAARSHVFFRQRVGHQFPAVPAGF